SARESAVAFEGLPAGYKEAVASLANAKLGDLYCKNNQQIWVEVFDPNITDLVNNNTDPKEVAKKMNDAANALL
ncbi:MAG: ABC transporter substrate-binding protein, partial [Thermomicrobiales bacterium]